MSSHGYNTHDFLVLTRATLLETLNQHREPVIVIGEQAIQLRTGGLDVAHAASTKGSEVILDRDRLPTTR